MDQATRELIHEIASRLWPAVPPQLVEAQVLVESNGNPSALSPAGARGLMQVMPATGKSLGFSIKDLADPEKNLCAGITYLKQQFKRFPEIGIYHERLNFALCAYNGGRGYVNKALQLARIDCGVSGDAPHPPGAWQRWEVAGAYLHHHMCKVNGRRPDAAQMLQYVARIRAVFWRLTNKEKGQ